MKTFFYKYWVVYYIIFFFLLGILIYALIELKTNNDLYSRLKEMNEKVNNCCQAKSKISDDIDRITDNQGGIGELTVTLIWNTIDDMDLGLREPSGKFISFEKFSKRGDQKISPNGGQLDIDMNAEELSIEPVENINYKNDLVKGSYHVYVNLYKSINDKPVEFQLIVRRNQKVIHSQMGISQAEGNSDKIISFEI